MRHSTSLIARVAILAAGTALTACTVQPAPVYRPAAPPVAYAPAPAPVVVARPPVPPPRYEAVPPPPPGGYIWRPGHWEWSNRYVWSPGRYVIRRPGWHNWVRGYWGTGGIWIAGHWG